jgi:hypothetical protein
MNRRVAMPSPSGRNDAKLYFPAGTGYAFDAASPKQRMTKRAFDRAYDYAVENHGQKAADALWAGMTSPAYERDEQEQEQAKDVEADPNPQLRKGGGFVDGIWHDDVSDLEHGDALPTYKSNGTPKNALAGDSNPLAGIVLPKIGHP